MLTLVSVMWILPIIILILIVRYFINEILIFPFRSSQSGESINYKLIHNYPGRPIILFCNGNVGTIEAGIFNTKNLCDKYQLNLCCFDYSRATTCGQILKDGEFIYNELISKGFKEEDIIICGVSIGTGVAAHLASIHKNVKGCILISPYINIISIAVGIRFGILFNYLSYLFINNPLATYQKINNIISPVILIHGLYDPLIPPPHSKYLAKIRNKYLLDTEEIYVDNGHAVELTSEVCEKIGNFFLLT